MGDTANWEFAAVVAAVAIGLGGLLLFTLIGAITAVRVSGAPRASAAPPALADAAVTPFGLAGVLAAQRALGVPQADPALAQASAQLLELARRADALLEQQARMIDAIRNLVEAGVLRAESSGEQYARLLDALDRVEGLLTRITTPGSR